MASKATKLVGRDHASSVFAARDDLELAHALPAAAFSLLMRAAEYAQNVSRLAWDFAVTVEELRQQGLTECDLRWLVCKGYLQHAEETSVSRSKERTFEHGPTVRFTRRSVFVLTADGMELASSLLDCNRQVGTARDECITVAYPQPDAPRWDRERRELRVGQVVVKRFTVPADNQEAILSAFEEEGWPVHIDDPLPPVDGIEPKRRLHSSIQCLNRNQQNHLLRFHGDGTGCGVLWELKASCQPA